MTTIYPTPFLALIISLSVLGIALSEFIRRGETIASYAAFVLVIIIIIATMFEVRNMKQQCKQ